jgi:hypothetical protein
MLARADGTRLGASEEIRRIRRVRWRALLAVVALVVAIELVSSFAWSHYEGPAVLRSRSLGSPAVALDRS